MNDQSHDISVGGELTPTGFRATIRSRFTSAVDRLLGSKVDRKTAPIEAELAEAAAITAGRVKIIETLTELGVERLKTDPALIEHALETFLPSLIRKQENKNAVIGLAAEDLQTNSRSGQEDEEGPSELSEEFLNRFERYAEEATSDILREKWGKVLAAEIRKPNTFSMKVLRVVDELEPSTAALFEQFCRHRLSTTVIKCLSGELSFLDKSALVSAGLLVEPGMAGQILKFSSGSDNTGKEIWLCNFGVAFAAIEKKAAIPEGVNDIPSPIAANREGPNVPVYVLSDVGYAVSSILRDHQETAFAEYMDKLADFIAPAVASEYRRSGDTTLRLVSVFSAEVSSPADK